MGGHVLVLNAPVQIPDEFFLLLLLEASAHPDGVGFGFKSQRWMIALHNVRAPVNPVEFV